MSDSLPSAREPADEVLATRIAAGDVAALSLIYDRYSRPVYTLAAHLLGSGEAEDIVQESFLRLWQKAGQYDADRGSFASWFLAIARHEVLARLRRLRLERRWALAGGVDQALTAFADPGPGTEESVWRRERSELVLRALNELPPEQRRVLVLAYFGGLSQSDIAGALELPLGTVKKRIRLGLQKLRTLLAPEESTSGMQGPPHFDGQHVVPRLGTDRTGVSVHDGL